MSHITNITRRNFLVGASAAAATGLIKILQVKEVAELSEAYRPPLMSLSTVRLARIEETLIKDRVKLLSYAPTLRAQEHDPADVFFGGAAAVYRADYRFPSIDYKKALKSIFSDSVYFVSFKSREDMILVDEWASTGDLDLLDEWERNPRSILARIEDKNLPLTLERSVEAVRQIEAAKRAIDAWHASLPRGIAQRSSSSRWALNVLEMR